MSLQAPSPGLLQITQNIGLTSSLLCSGVNLCASHLTIPLLFGLPITTCTKAFASLYKRGIPVVAPLVIVSGLANAALAYWDPRERTFYAMAGLSTFATLRWTQLVMMSTKMRLVRFNEDERERDKVSHGEMDGMLRSWQWMALVRAGMSLVGGVVGAWTALS